MSELIKKNDNRATIRWKLLTGASALALAVSSGGLAHAEDAAKPQIWIELGGDLSRLQDGQETFAPEFPNSPPRPSVFAPSQKFERPPLFSFDEDGKISFQPENSDWIFSAAIRYGRSTSSRHVVQQTHNSYPFTENGSITHVYHYAVKFAETGVRNTEQNTILDFQAGHDVGLGIFGKDTSSTVSLGVRFAQFRSGSNIFLRSDPDWAVRAKYYTAFKIPVQKYHSNAAEFSAQRSFRGIGPSLSWNGSTPFVGNSQDGELAVDWGVNAGLLFGKQKTRTHHQTTGSYMKYHTRPHPITYQAPATPDHFRSKSVTVPNISGFAGISYNYADAKLSLGYRADFFFNAMDGGIDTRKSENRGFYGPYASISIGLGD